MPESRAVSVHSEVFHHVRRRPAARFAIPHLSKNCIAYVASLGTATYIQIRQYTYIGVPFQ